MGDSTPFIRECRAFGRLKATGNEDLAVKVYGHADLDTRDPKIRREIDKALSEDPDMATWV